MTTTAELAYRSVRQMLFDGHLQAGQRVSQQRLARKLNCSKAPIVEALRRLESDGLLVKEGRKMAKVRVLLASEIKGLYLLRQSLEMTAIQLCTEAIDDQEIRQLLQLEQKFEAAAANRELRQATQLDMEIHRFIVRCARCPLFQQELDRLMVIERTIPGDIADEREWEKYLDSTMASPGISESESSGDSNWKKYGQSHKSLITAIADRDSELAQMLMKKHIQNGYKETLERLRFES